MKYHAVYGIEPSWIRVAHSKIVITSGEGKCVCGYVMGVGVVDKYTWGCMRISVSGEGISIQFELVPFPPTLL